MEGAQELQPNVLILNNTNHTTPSSPSPLVDDQMEMVEMMETAMSSPSPMPLQATMSPQQSTGGGGGVLETVMNSPQLREELAVRVYQRIEKENAAASLSPSSQPSHLGLSGLGVCGVSSPYLSPLSQSQGQAGTMMQSASVTTTSSPLGVMLGLGSRKKRTHKLFSFSSDEKVASASQPPLPSAVAAAGAVVTPSLATTTDTDNTAEPEQVSQMEASAELQEDEEESMKKGKEEREEKERKEKEKEEKERVMEAERRAKQQRQRKEAALELLETESEDKADKVVGEKAAVELVCCLESPRVGDDDDPFDD